MAVTPATKSIRQTELVPRASEIRRLADLINNEKRDFTAAEKESWDKVNAEYESIKARVEIQERAAALESDLGKPADPDIRDYVTADYNGYKQLKKWRQEQKRDKQKKEEEKAVLRAEERKARQYKRMGWLNPTITTETKCDALQGWCRAQRHLPLKRHHVDACKRINLNPRNPELRVRALMPTDPYGKFTAAARPWHDGEIRASQALNANVAGGYLVPEGFVQNLEIALLLYSNIRTWADVMRTNSGQDLPWPSANDTFNKGQILVENAQVQSGPTVVFAQTVLHAYKYTSNLVQVPVELMEDSAFDLAAVLGNLLGIRIARIQNDHFTFGTGVAQPLGAVTAATQGVQAASPTALAWDDLYKLKHAVDPAYRQAALQVGWMFHDQILSWLKRLKDGTGRYLWQAGVATGVPDTIDGDPFMVNQSMSATMSTGNKTVMYGAWKKLKIRDVSQVRMRRLVERYADLDQEGFVMFARADATVLDAGTHPLQYIVH